MADNSFPESPRHNSNLAFWLFSGFFCFYFLCLGGHIYTPDGTIMFRVTQSFTDERRLDIKPLTNWPGFGGSESTDPKTGEKKFFSKYGPGLSIAAIPFYYAGKCLLPLISAREKGIFDISRIVMAFPDASGKISRTPVRGLWYKSGPGQFDEAFLAFSATCTNPFLGAGIVMAIFCACGKLGFSTPISLVTAILAGIATPLWHYSKEFFSEPLSAFGFIWFFYFALAESKKGKPGAGWFWAGLFLGISVSAKLANLVALLPCGILVFLYLRNQPSSEIIRGLLLFSLGLAIFSGISFLYNYLRFDSFFATGYGDEINRWETPFFEGLYGLLLSPGRGLLIYCPLIILSLAGFFQFAGSFPREAIFIALMNVTFLGMYSKWHMWEGGWCWGPRFLLPLIPLSILPVACIIQKFPSRPLLRILTVLIISISFITAVNGVIVSYNDYSNWLQKLFRANSTIFTGQGMKSEYDLIRWDWDYSPVFAYWSFPVKDYFLLSRAFHNPGTILVFFMIAFAGILLSCHGIRNNFRTIVREGKKVDAQPFLEKVSVDIR